MLDALQANDGQVDGDEEVDQYEDPQHYEVNPFANFSPESEVMWNRLVAEPALTIDGKPRHELDGCLWYNKGHTPNKWGFHLKWRCCDPDCQATASSFRKEVDGVDFNVKALRPHTTSDMAASFCQQIQNFELLKLKARWFITRLCLHEEYRYSVARDTVLALMNAFNPSSTNDFALGPLEQTVKTKRRKLFPAVPTLGNQELFDLPPLYRKTISGELFLLCNCTINGATPGRMMVFATGSFLANLFQVLRVHIEGTFKPTPRPFTQLFTMSLMYLARLTRPDILLPVAHLSTRSHCCTKGDMHEAYKICRYLRGTRNKGIHIHCTSMRIQAECDASHIVHTDRKSHTGYKIGLGDNLSFLHCKSCKQKLTAQSSTDAEVIAMVDCLKMCVWLRNLLQELHITPLKRMVIYQDNKSAIIMTQDDNSKAKNSKHIFCKIGYARDLRKLDIVEIVYLPTGEMTADMLTKPLHGEQFRTHRAKLMGHTRRQYSTY